MSPRDANELTASMAERFARADKLTRLDLRQLNRVLELAPEDMTVTVECGIILGNLQSELARHGQWLPIDPPNSATVSLHEILSRNLNGPRRFGYGTIREHLIGMKVVLADGRLIKSGGKVVKNVAGYDLAKLFIGARDSLGVIVEATFKLRPLPEVERLVGTTVPLGGIAKTLRAVFDSAITPVILDAHRLNGPDDSASLVLGLAGTREEVEWQLNEARALGFEAPATLGYESEFWNHAGPVHRISVLPSRVSETIADLGSRSFVARAGNGVIYYHGERLPRASEKLPHELMQRVKNAYDPKNILPEFTA